MFCSCLVKSIIFQMWMAVHMSCCHNIKQYKCCCYHWQDYPATYLYNSLQGHIPSLSCKLWNTSSNLLRFFWKSPSLVENIYVISRDKQQTKILNTLVQSSFSLTISSNIESTKQNKTKQQPTIHKLDISSLRGK